jgi:hypothetical protein
MLIKQVCTICVLVLLASACKKEQLAPTTMLNETIVITDTNRTASEPILTGTFSPGPYGNVTGKAETYKQGMMYSVKLSDFNTSNGPALHVYLSKEPMPVNFIDLGVLKSTNGNQVYAVTGMPDFAEYKYISIHCVAYNHLFGSALLK